MDASSPSKPKDEDASELEHAVADLHALKKLYGLLQQNHPKSTQGDDHQDSLDDKSRHMFKKLLDGATQQVLQCQAKIVSCSLEPPSPMPAIEPREDHRPETLPELTLQSTSSSEKPRKSLSIVQRQNHTTCSTMVDDAPQQVPHCQANIFSSALVSSPLSLSEEHVQTLPVKEPAREPRAELQPERLLKSTRQSEKLQKSYSFVHCGKHTSCNSSVDIAAKQLFQSRDKRAPFALEPPPPSPFEDHVRPSASKEPGRDPRLETLPGPIQKSTRPSGKLRKCHSNIQPRKQASCNPSVDASPQQVQQCHSKPVRTGLESQPSPLEEPVRASLSKEPGREPRLKPLPQPIQKTARPSEKLRKCHSLGHHQNHASCNPSLDAAPQQVRRCQAKIDSPATGFLPSPSEEPVRPSLSEEPTLEPRPEAQKKPKASEKLQKCHSFRHREKQSSGTSGVRALPATKLNEDRADPLVAAPKVKQKPSQGRQRIDLMRQMSQRSIAVSTTGTGTQIHHPRDADRPSRTNSRRMNHGPQDPMTHPPPCGSLKPVKQKRIRAGSSELPDSPIHNLEQTEEHLAQKKPTKSVNSTMVPRRCPAKPVASEKKSMQLHRTASSKIGGSKRTTHPDQVVENESSDRSHLYRKEHAAPGSRLRHTVLRDPSSKPRRRPSQEGINRRGRLSPCPPSMDGSIDLSPDQSTCPSSMDGSIGLSPDQSTRSPRILRRSTPISRGASPSSRSLSTGSATSSGSGSSSTSSMCASPPHAREEEGSTSPRRMPTHHSIMPRQLSPPLKHNTPPSHHSIMPRQLSPPHKHSTPPHRMPNHRSITPRRSSPPSKHSLSTEMPQRQHNYDKPTHRLLTHQLALVPTKRGDHKKKPEKQLALVRTDHQKGQPEKEGRLRRMKNKLAVIFHHHHHHHLHPGGPESKAVSNTGIRHHHHHASLWEYIRRVLHHSSNDGRKRVVEAQRGFMHVLLDGVLQHVWGTRQRKAAKAKRRKLGKVAGGRGARRLHWWQWFRKKRGMKLASRNKPRFRLAFKGKKS